MPFYENGSVRIRFEEAGKGYPLLMIAGGGLNATMDNLRNHSPFDPVAALQNEYRCIFLDQRNAPDGASTGPVDPAKNWDSFTDDQLGLLDHLGIDKFLVLGFCIGGPQIWNLLKRAPKRVIAGVLAQPSGSRPEKRGFFYERNMKGWGQQMLKLRPEIGEDTIEKFLRATYLANDDFVFTVTRDFVKSCQTPVLILPDDIDAHPYETAMEAAMLAPNAEVSMFPWKHPPERVPLAVRQIRSFLRAQRPQ